MTESVRVLPRGVYSLVKELPCLPTSIIRIYGGSSPKTIIEALSSSEKSILHLHLLLPDILLPIGLDIEQELTTIILFLMPSDHIKVTSLFLKSSQHRFIVFYNLFVVSKSFFKIQRSFAILLQLRKARVFAEKAASR